MYLMCLFKVWMKLSHFNLRHTRTIECVSCTGARRRDARGGAGAGRGACPPGPPRSPRRAHNVDHAPRSFV